VPLTGAPS